jgi:hypothetical protein
MLTSFFGKSNPINYLLLGILIFVAYFLKVFIVEELDTNLSSIFGNLVFAILTSFTMLLLDFIIRKNHLTKSNTYGIFLFSCFLVAIPSIFMDNQSLFACIFLMLAFRRILSFRTNKNLEKKILDAALWITLASFFYFWSFLYFFVLYFALVQKSNTNYKQLLIPIIGFFGMFILATTFYYLTSNSFAWFFKWKTPISLDFSAYNYGGVLLPTSIIFTFLIWTGLARFFKLGKMSKKERPYALILLVTLVVTVFMGLASPQKTGSELFFLLIPLVIIITNYIENIEEFWFKEVLLWLALLLPLIVFIL